jgi:hypothetical protein
MFKLKNFAVAAVLTMSAVGAMASNFRAADQVYLPIGGHAVGGSGLFVSDLFVSNLEQTDSVTVSMIYSSGTGGTQTTNFAPIVLAAGERRELVDFFGALGVSGLGQVIFNACKTGGDCSATCPNGDTSSGTCPDFRKITVQSRIYSVPNSSAAINTQNTTGQDMTGLPWYSYASMDQAANGLDKVFITGIRFTGTGGVGTYRTNIGLVNASQFSSTTLRVKIFNNIGTLVSSADQTLQPLGQTQIGLNNPAFNPAITAGASQTGLWATVEQASATPVGTQPAGCGVNGCPGFFAYGSILDNASGDATTLESQFLKSLDYALGAIYPGTSGSGKSGLRHVAGH